MAQLLTAPEGCTGVRAYRYYVELASTQTDANGITESTRVIDVVVTLAYLECARAVDSVV